MRVDLDALRERAEVIAAVPARVGPHALAGLLGERLRYEHYRGYQGVTMAQTSRVRMT